MTQRVKLGGRYFNIIGRVHREPVNEFATGIRIGRPDRENRQHVFTWEMSDWTGGFGVERIDSPQEEGRFFDSEDGIDTRWPGMLMLPPLFTTEATAEGEPTNAQGQFFRFGSDLWFTAQSKALFRRNSGAWTKEAMPAGANSLGDALVVFTPSGGTASIYNSREGQVWQSSTGLALSWTDVSGGTNRAGLLFVYDDKLFGLYQGKVYFTVDGTNWTQIGPNGSGTAPFNVKVGIAHANFPDATGEVLPHILEGTTGAIPPETNEGLHLFDFWSGKFLPLDAGIPPGLDGVPGGFSGMTPYQGGLAVARNSEVYHYRPGNTALLGPLRASDRHQGLPDALSIPTMRVWNPHRSSIFLWLPYGSYDLTVNTKSSALLCFTGKGWHILYRSAAASVVGVVYLDHGTSATTLYIAEHTANGASIDWAFKASTVLPDIFNPLHGGQPFAAAGSLITPWFTGGFSDLPGIAFAVRITGRQLTSTETCKVEYAMNGGAAFSTLGTFTATGQRLDFPSGSVSNDGSSPQGSSFDTIRFRFTLARGVTTTLTPVVESLVFEYLKLPELRYKYDVTLDLETTETPDADQEFLIDFLEDLYDNDQLVHFQWGRQNTWVTCVGMPSDDEPPDMEVNSEGRTSQVRVSLLEPVAGLRWRDTSG